MSNSSELNPIMDKFYLSMLSYAGMNLDDGIIKNTNSQLGEITIDGKHLTLPYFSNLKNPNNRIIFHPLNENYTNPENTVFNFYKKRLVLELNLKLSYMIINLITIASDVQMQQKIKSSKLIDIVSNIGETDMVLNENFAHMLKASKKVNSEAFLFDIFLKKNGEINDVPYAAIGKINFISGNEINKALEDKELDYKVFGYKLRKKDLLALSNIFNILFPNFSDKDIYIEGTDNKIFRYLNVLMKTSYMISNRINELCVLLEELKEPTLKLVDCYSDLDWSKQLENLYSMATDIRLIPSQLDVTIESQHHLNVNETASTIIDKVKQQEIQEFNPSMVSVSQQQPTTINQPQQPQTLSAEEIIKRNLLKPQHPNIYPGNVNMAPMNYVPTWVQQESIANNMNNNLNNPTGNNYTFMTPQGPATMTPTGPVLVNQNPNMNMMPNMNINPNMNPMMPNMNPMMPGMNMVPNMNPMMPGMNMMPNMNINPNMNPMMSNMNMMPNMNPMMGKPDSGIEFNPLFSGR